MQQKKSINFGFRGWMLILFQAIAFATFQAATNYPLNIMNSMFDGFAGSVGGGQQLLAMIYTIAAVVAIIIQLIVSSKVGRVKSMKTVAMVLGGISLVLLLLMMILNPFSATVPWLICYGIVNVTSVMYATFAIGILIGQWFPTRKGTVMGIATFAFPIANGLIGAFAGSIFGGAAPVLGGVVGEALGKATDGASAGALGNILGLMEQGNLPGAIGNFQFTEVFASPAGDAFKTAVSSTIFRSFLPFFIVFVVGWLIGLIFIKDYPEQVGAYRDNDKSLTPEIAKAMMEQEIENKKTTVWKLGHTLKNRDFWFITLPMGFLLMFSIGTMTLTQDICAAVGIVGDGYSSTMVMIMIFGLIGSYILGLLDTKFGTKKSILIALCIMVIAGILGFVSSPNNPGLLRASLICLALFMGASSNYTVSAAAQYWRREDFSSVFAVVNPIANILGSSGPMIISALYQKSYNAIFLVTGIIGVISLILCGLFSKGHVKEVDDKYRAAAGKPLDDALVGRK